MMKRVWEWFKKYWKWFIAPLWILSLVLIWIFKGGEGTMFPPSGTTDEAADEAMAARKAATDAFRARLDELAKKAEERLKNASEDQLKEYEELKDKPLDEIATWIDNLS